MRQKILVIAALFHEKEVLILDEPFSGLVVNSAMILRSLLRGFAERRKMVLYSSHVLEVVEKVCDKVLILSKGRVVAHDSMGIPLIAGREFAPAEANAGIVSQTLTRLFWNRSSPLGRQLKLPDGTAVTIVGIAKDIDPLRFGGTDNPPLFDHSGAAQPGMSLRSISTRG